MNIKTLIMTFSLSTAVACGGGKDAEPSKPVTCEVAGQMVSKRMGEYADKANVTGAKRTELDKAMAVAITKRCVEDKWDEVPLGCLGAMATIREGEIDVPTYRKGVDICTRAIGPDNEKKVDAAVGEVVRSIMKSQPQ
jgi:hypothetical protein